jgi:hypothetical protein
MRKLVVCNIMSLDGYYTGPGDDVMVMPMDEAFDAYNAERLRAADTSAAPTPMTRSPSSSAGRAGRS